MLSDPTLELYLFYSFSLFVSVWNLMKYSVAVKAAGNYWPQLGIHINQVRQQLERKKNHMDIISESIKIQNSQACLSKQ